MALITTVTPAFIDDGPYKYATFKVTGCTTGDTIDLTSHFRRIIGAAFVSMSGGGVYALCTVAGNVVTVVNAGMVNDGGYLMVVGASF